MNEQSSDCLRIKIEYAKEILKHNSHIINMADSKSGFLLAINGVVLALILGLPKDHHTSLYSFYFLMLTSFILGVSCLCCIFTLYPRLTKNIDTMIYSDNISKIKENVFMEKWNNITEFQIMEEYSKNIYNIQKIRHKKNISFKIAVISIVIGIVNLIPTIYLYFNT